MGISTRTLFLADRSLGVKQVCCHWGWKVKIISLIKILVDKDSSFATSFILFQVSSSFICRVNLAALVWLQEMLSICHCGDVPGAYLETAMYLLGEKEKIRSSDGGGQAEEE